MDPVDPALQPVIVLRVVIRSPDLPTFVAKYSRFIKDDRIFIFTKSSQPPGTRVRFTLELSDGTRLIHGEGTVTRVRPDAGDPSKPPGMELRFIPLDEASRELTDRMLRARESTGQFAAVTTPPPPPGATPSHFREETTDAQTNIRDATGATPNRREFDESVPTLQPLEKTGAQPVYRPEPPRQDESGAVTLAQAPPSEATPPPPLPSLPRPLDIEKQSGGFSTPTPLPAPIPAAPDEFGNSPPPTKMARPSPSDALTTGVPSFANDTNEPAFASQGPAPAFAEAFRTPIPGTHAPSTVLKSTVPANPFSEISDGAIEYFVEWSLEQSTAPKPKVAEAHFGKIVMATPRAEKRRSMRGPLLSGMAIGIFLGLPLGGAIVWFLRPLPPPVIVEKMPEPVRPPVAVADLAVVATREAAPDLGVAVGAAKPTAVAVKPSGVAVKPSGVAVAPSGVAVKPSGVAVAATGDAAKPTSAKKGELAINTHPEGAAITVDGEAQGKTPLVLSLPAGSHDVSLVHERYAPVTETVDVPGKLEVTLKRPTATLHVDSEPAGGEVIVQGKPRGKTPVDVTLDAFQHYDVQVMLLGTKPWRKRVALKPPQTDVTAKLSVVHNP